MRRLFVKIMIIIICFSLQLVATAPKTEARDFFDVVFGLADIFSPSAKNKKSSSYFSADMPVDGSPVKLQAVGVSSGEWVSTHYITLENPAEITLTASGYRPMIIKHYLYDFDGREIGTLSSYEGASQSIVRTLAPGSYNIKSYSYKEDSSNKMDCELIMQKQDIYLNSTQDKPKSETGQLLYSDTPLYDYLPFRPNDDDVFTVYAFYMTYTGSIKLIMERTTQSCDLIFYLGKYENKKIEEIESWDGIYEQKEEKVFSLTPGYYALIVRSQYKGGGGYKLMLQ